MLRVRHIKRFLNGLSYLVVSQGEFIEEGAGEDALGQLSILWSNQCFDRLGSESLGINDTEHASILLFLAVLVEHQEGDGTGAHFKFSEVAQVHKGALGEQGEVSVTQPDEETAWGLLVDAWILVEGLSSTEASTGVEHKPPCSFLGQAGQ